MGKRTVDFKELTWTIAWLDTALKKEKESYGRKWVTARAGGGVSWE